MTSLKNRTPVFWYTLAFVIAVLVTAGALATVYTLRVLDKSKQTAKEITELALKLLRQESDSRAVLVFGDGQTLVVYDDGIVPVSAQPHRLYIKDCSFFAFARCVEAVYWTGDFGMAPAARYRSSQATPYDPVSNETVLNFRFFDVPAGYASLQVRLA